ncbi:hypothetical protein HPB51_019897 [Rhipicephalus microplus]|uniref:Striatin N-terminal domain-containing protein n=1 Tax=Rhipicephalus microplus TaxID=6941 RepID=A0A9J6E2P7_RHIMP|nr:hypothetical protein HPB51_019897 [Rhipicephalus microplus]
MDVEQQPQRRVKKSPFLPQHHTLSIIDTNVFLPRTFPLSHTLAFVEQCRDVAAAAVWYNSAARAVAAAAARIAFLQGERKGQENLKNDLIRRIKMLEFALKQERIKSHKLKYDTDPNPAELKAPVFDDVNKEEPMDGELFITSNSNVSWRQGRQLLRQYLQEIGYTDTILDVRSARVRTLLGLGPATNAGSGNAPEDKAAHPTVNGGSAGGTAPGEPIKQRASDTQRRVPGKKIVNVAENALLDTEASVLATFDFLATENVDMEDDEDNFSDEMEDAVSADDEAEERMDNRRIKSKVLGSGDELGEADTENVLTEFDFLGPDSTEGREGGRNQGDGSEWDGCAVDDDEEDEEEMAQRWGADPQLINQLVEEYRRERRGRKGTSAPVSSQRPKRSALQAMLASLSTPGTAAASSNEGGQGGNPPFAFVTNPLPRIPAFSAPSAPPPAVPSSSASQNLSSTSPSSTTFGMAASGDIVVNGQLGGRQPIAARIASYSAFLEEADNAANTEISRPNGLTPRNSSISNENETSGPELKQEPEETRARGIRGRSASGRSSPDRALKMGRWVPDPSLQGLPPAGTSCCRVPAPKDRGHPVLNSFPGPADFGSGRRATAVGLRARAVRPAA